VKLGPLRRAFATTVSASAAPYGYTLTVWSSGALLIHFRGSPAVGRVPVSERSGGGVRGALAAWPPLHACWPTA
jgi:hypothetical protein